MKLLPFPIPGPTCLSALSLGVQSWSLCSKGFSLRDTHKPQVSIVVKLHPFRLQNAKSSVSVLLHCFLQGIHGPCRIPPLSVGGPTPKSTAFMLQCLFGGLGLEESVDRRKRPSTTPEKDRHLVEGTAAALLKRGDSGSVESHWPSPGYHPFPWLRIGLQDMSGFLCFTQTRTLQAFEFAFFCVRNVTSSFPISIWSTPLPNPVFSGPLLSPSWCLSLLPSCLPPLD